MNLDEEVREDEIALPAQFATPFGARLLRLIPEARLWVAVLEDAIRCARRDGRLGAEAREWFTSPSEDVGSFRWIALQLGVEPDAVQPGVLDAIASGKLKAHTRRMRERSLTQC